MFQNFLLAYYPSVSLPNIITEKIIFFPSHCIVQDMSTGMRIGSGHERRGMYYLDDRVTITSLVVGNIALLWHWRLGHPSVQMLWSVVLIDSSVSTLGDESCELGKHYRTTYQSRINNHSSFVFELVHSDVWGPSRVPSVKGFKYFLIFVDDFSR